MNAPNVRCILHELEPGATIAVKGWLRSRRDSKAGLSFLELNDGSCLKSLQVLAPAELDNYQSLVKQLPTGASLEVEGVLEESPGQGQRVELKAERIALVGDAPEDYPLQKKRHGFEYLREIAHLRCRTNAFGAVFRVRHQLAMAVHDFFRQQDFLWVHTPIITASDAEGAGELFRVSTLSPEKPPVGEDGKIDFKQDFFARQAYLTVSGQLQAETLACGLSRVYTFGPTFRAENSNTARHAAEFWMIEPEVAFHRLPENADLAEAFLKHVLGHVLEHCAEDMEFFDLRIEKGLIESLRQVVDSPFERISYTEAIERLQASHKSFEHAPVWGHSLQTEHERYLTEELLKRPVIVTDYPGENTAFYMRLNDDQKTVRAMDVLVPRVGELIGGSEREERYEVLVERMKAHHIDPEDYRWYLDLRRYGSVPHAGFGVGFERLIMMATGMKNIRDVIPYPRTPRSADF